MKNKQKFPSRKPITKHSGDGSSLQIQNKTKLSHSQPSKLAKHMARNKTKLMEKNAFKDENFAENYSLTFFLRLSPKKCKRIINNNSSNSFVIKIFQESKGLFGRLKTLRI